MFGHFSPESLREFAEAYGLDPGMQDFSEGVFDFKVCQKADGKHYGISDNEKCGKGAREVTKAPSKGFLGMSPGKAINFETAKLQGDAATKNYPRKKVDFLRNLPDRTPEQKEYNKKIYDRLKGYEQFYLTNSSAKSKGNGPLAAKLASLTVDAQILRGLDLIKEKTYQDYCIVAEKSPEKIDLAQDLIFKAAVKGKGEKAANELAKLAQQSSKPVKQQSTNKPAAPKPKPQAQKTSPKVNKTALLEQADYAYFMAIQAGATSSNEARRMARNYLGDKGYDTSQLSDSDWRAIREQNMR